MPTVETILMNVFLTCIAMLDLIYLLAGWKEAVGSLIYRGWLLPFIAVI